MLDATELIEKVKKQEFRRGFFLGQALALFLAGIVILVIYVQIGNLHEKSSELVRLADANTESWKQAAEKNASLIKQAEEREADWKETATACSEAVQKYAAERRQPNLMPLLRLLK